jgi:DNA processing protein
MHDSHYLVFLHSSGCTHNDLKKLFPLKETFDPKYIWENLISWLEQIEMVEERKSKIVEKSKKVDTEGIVALLSSKEIQIVHLYTENYPEKLKNLGHAPFFLYVRGVLDNNILLLGVVWSRKHTPYAKKILEKILPDIIESGMGTISGGATGVDTLGHEITLEKSGYTLAVFGTGIDRCYPANNKILFEKIIAQGGAIISHFPLGTGPELYNFPMRNELVAGLSSGILIPEAGLSSGTLITAQLALEHGRDVFAVPGDIDRSTSEGTNMLIASGQAKIVRCAGDVLEEYFDIGSIGAGMTPIIKTPPVFENHEEKRIYEALENNTCSVDAIGRYTNLEISEVLTHLAMLEIRGYITMDEMGKYQIV